VLPATPAAPAKLRKFPCVACGADVVWNPGAASLTCPYCGAKRDVPKAPGEVTERPIEEALKGASDLGWGLSRKAVSCRGCGATTTFDAGVAASRCAFCGAPGVVDRARAGRAGTASEHQRRAKTRPRAKVTKALRVR